MLVLDPNLISESFEEARCPVLDKHHALAVEVDLDLSTVSTFLDLSYAPGFHRILLQARGDSRTDTI
jgi:hypothetical protein